MSADLGHARGAISVKEIQKRIDKARSGDVIRLDADTYELSQTLRIDKPDIQLVGSATAFFESKPLEPMVRITAHGCSITGVDFFGLENISKWVGSPQSRYLAAVSVENSFTTLTGCSFQGKSSGIVCGYSSHNSFNHNVFHGMLRKAQDGCRWHAGVTVIAGAGNDICDNRFFWWGNPVLTGTTSKLLKVTGNSMFDCWNNGIYAAAGHSVFSHNRINRVDGKNTALKIRGYGNVISSNVIWEVPDGIGITLTPTSMESAEGNVIVANTIAGAKNEGIRIDGRRNSAPTSVSLAANQITGSREKYTILGNCDVSIDGQKIGAT